MDHQGAPNVDFHHYTLKNSELAKNWPSSGPRLSRISTYLYIRSHFRFVPIFKLFLVLILYYIYNMFLIIVPKVYSNTQHSDLSWPFYGSIWVKV